MTVCSVDSCDRCAERRGWCTAHYKRWKRHGDPHAGRRAPLGGPCSIDGCDKPHRTGGYCNMHAIRVRTHGDPHLVGAEVSYTAIHARLRRLLGHASEHVCRHCGAEAAHWAYDHSDPAESVDPRGCFYSADPAHYMPLCVSCHWTFDGAAERLHARAA